jgi:DNA-binding Lrp family transcriptional regulator
LEINPHLTLKEVGKRLNLSEEAVRYYIRKLKNAGKIKKIGGPKKGIWRIIKK